MTETKAPERSTKKKWWLLGISCGCGCSLLLLLLISLFCVLLPALTKARNAAEKIRCKNRLIQLNNSLAEYAAANDGYMPDRAGQAGLRQLPPSDQLPGNRLECKIHGYRGYFRYPGPLDDYNAPQWLQCPLLIELPNGTQTLNVILLNGNVRQIPVSEIDNFLEAVNYLNSEFHYEANVLEHLQTEARQLDAEAAGTDNRKKIESGKGEI